MFTHLFQPSPNAEAMPAPTSAPDMTEQQLFNSLCPGRPTVPLACPRLVSFFFSKIFGSLLRFRFACKFYPNVSVRSCCLVGIRWPQQKSEQCSQQQLLRCPSLAICSRTPPHGYHPDVAQHGPWSGCTCEHAHSVRSRALDNLGKVARPSLATDLGHFQLPPVNRPHLRATCLDASNSVAKLLHTISLASL